MLQIEDVRVGYHRSSVLHGVSVEVPKDGVAAVLGHNGAGKSTLLRAAVGLLTPSSGTVRLDGEDITRRKPHERVARGMAYVPQGQQAFPHLTTAENLQLVADGRKRGKAAIAEALDLFPALRTLSNRRAGLLSGGQRQQLAIARALVTEPRILLLDEPTEGIQPSIIKDIGRVIRMLAGRGEMAIVLVEQYYDFAAELADQYLVMERGEVIARGRGSEMEVDGVRRLMSI